MPIFEFRARHTDGKAVSGTVAAGDLGAAASELARRGLNVEHLGLASMPGDPLAAAKRDSPSENAENQGDGPKRPSGIPVGPPLAKRPRIITDLWGPMVGKVPLTSLQFFFRQFGTMLHAGVPMVQCLDTLSKQTSHPKLKTIVEELRDHVREGRAVTVGLDRYPEVFSTLIVSLVRSGERSGFLDEACYQTAHYLEREIELRNLYKRITFYPKLVVAAAIVIALVADAILKSLGKAGYSTPLTTWTTWLFLGPLAIGIFLFLRIGLANPVIKEQWDRFVARLPMIGPPIQQLAMAKFGRAFGALYQAGVPVRDSIQFAADACGNEYIRSRVYPVAAMVDRGATLTQTFHASGVFSPIVLDMTNTGETTGNIEMMLTKVAEFYEGEAETKQTQVAYGVGVLALLAVGGYVGYMVISTFSGYVADIGRAG